MHDLNAQPLPSLLPGLCLNLNCLHHNLSLRYAGTLE
jgi:hypothetical protein